MIVPQTPAWPVVLIIHDTHRNRFHPIVYWECPLPGQELGAKMRWKSKGHHTEGFETFDEAVNSPKGGLFSTIEAHYQIPGGVIGDIHYQDTEALWSWNSDEEPIPTDVQCFTLDKFKKYEKKETETADA